MIIKLLFKKTIFIIPLLLIPFLCPKASALETEINLNNDDRPIKVVKDTTFTDSEITKIDSLIEQIPSDIRDELIDRYTVLWDRILDEVGIYIGDPTIWRSSETYKEFLGFIEPIGLGLCPFFLKKLSENDIFSINFIGELTMPEYEYLRENILSYSYYTEEGNYFPPDPLFSWMLLGRALLEMPDDIWVINTSVAVGNSQNLPDDFKLEQNHPNPFNPITEIQYALPSATNVTLKIYNILGQEIAVLIDNELIQAGWHSTVWDSRDIFGNNVASGIYFCRLTAGNQVITQKIMLTR